MRNLHDVADLEIILALGRYKSGQKEIKARLRKFIAAHKRYLMSIDQVRELLALEVPQSVQMSEEIVMARRRERGAES